MQRSTGIPYQIETVLRRIGLTPARIKTIIDSMATSKLSDLDLSTASLHDSLCSDPKHAMDPGDCLRLAYAMTVIEATTMLCAVHYMMKSDSTDDRQFMTELGNSVRNMVRMQFDIHVHQSEYTKHSAHGVNFAVPVTFLKEIPKA